MITIKKTIQYHRESIGFNAREVIRLCNDLGEPMETIEILFQGRKYAVKIEEMKSNEG